MDRIDHRYRSRMRIAFPDGIREVEGQWHWSPAGAQMVPFLHPYLALEWHRTDVRYPGALGEIRGSQRSATEDDNPRYDGQHICGSEDDWNGLTNPEAWTPLSLDDEGVPTCCGVGAVWYQGLLLNGSGRWVFEGEGGLLLGGTGFFPVASASGGLLLNGAGLWVNSASGGLLLNGTGYRPVFGDGGLLLNGAGSWPFVSEGGGLQLGGAGLFAGVSEGGGLLLAGDGLWPVVSGSGGLQLGGAGLWPVVSGAGGLLLDGDGEFPELGEGGLLLGSAGLFPMTSGGGGLLLGTGGVFQSVSMGGGLLLGGAGVYPITSGGGGLLLGGAGVYPITSGGGGLLLNGAGIVAQIGGGGLLLGGAGLWEDPDMPITGELRMFALTAPPAGWLVADGSLVSRTTYAALFAAIGTTYGVGDGSTTFGLPRCIGQVPVGAGIAFSGMHWDQGTYYGNNTHTLTVPELPAHHHTVYGQTANTGSGGVIDSLLNVHGNGDQLTSDTGTGTPFQVIQESMTCLFCIKT